MTITSVLILENLTTKQQQLFQSHYQKDCINISGDKQTQVYAKQVLGDEPTDVHVEPKIKRRQTLQSNKHCTSDLVAAARNVEILQTNTCGVKNIFKTSLIVRL